MDDLDVTQLKSDNQVLKCENQLLTDEIKCLRFNNQAKDTEVISLRLSCESIPAIRKDFADKINAMRECFLLQIHELRLENQQLREPQANGPATGNTEEPTVKPAVERVQAEERVVENLALVSPIPTRTQQEEENGRLTSEAERLQVENQKQKEEIILQSSLLSDLESKCRDIEENLVIERRKVTELEVSKHTLIKQNESLIHKESQLEKTVEEKQMELTHLREEAQTSGETSAPCSSASDKCSETESNCTSGHLLYQEYQELTKCLREHEMSIAELQQPLILVNEAMQKHEAENLHLKAEVSCLESKLRETQTEMLNSCCNDVKLLDKALAVIDEYEQLRVLDKAQDDDAALVICEDTKKNNSAVNLDVEKHKEQQAENERRLKLLSASEQSELISQLGELENQIDEKTLLLQTKDEVIDKQYTQLLQSRELVMELYCIQDVHKQRIQELQQQLEQNIEERVVQNLAKELSRSALAQDDLEEETILDIVPQTSVDALQNVSSTDENEEIGTVSDGDLCQISVQISGSSNEQSHCSNSDSDNLEDLEHCEVKTVKMLCTFLSMAKCIAKKAVRIGALGLAVFTVGYGVGVSNQTYDYGRSQLCGFLTRTEDFLF